MAKFKVLMASKNRDYSFKGNDGSDVSMVEYNLGVEDETGKQVMPKMSRSAKKDAPKVGDEIEGTLEESEKFGLQLKEARTGGGGGGRGGYGGKSPAERMEIIRQSSVERAGEFMRDKGNFLLRMFELNLIDEKELKAHAKNYSGTHLLNVALYIAVYDLGKWDSKATPEQMAEIMQGVQVEMKQVAEEAKAEKEDKPADQGETATEAPKADKADNFDKLPPEDQQREHNQQSLMPNGEPEQKIDPSEIPDDLGKDKTLPF